MIRLLVFLIPIILFAGNRTDWESRNDRDIFYDIGNVGIGTSTSIDANLEVCGNISTTSLTFSDGTSMSTAGGSASTLDQAYDGGGSGVGRTIIADSGPVSITGNLEVSSAISAGTLQVGAGTFTDPDTVHIFGSARISHTATENDDHAVEIDVDAAGFSDVKALDINYITGAISAGEDEEIILINIDESNSTGGRIAAIEVLSTTSGSSKEEALFVGVGIDPIEHLSGTFANADSVLSNSTSISNSVQSGGAGGVSIFVSDDDTITIGSAVKFEEIEIILAVGASQGGIGPTFAFSNGGGFTSFGPVDSTNGFRNTGIIAYEDSDIPTWAIDGNSEFTIKITRTRNNLTTTPIIDLLQIAAATEFKWNSSGNLTINNITSSGEVSITGGNLTVKRSDGFPALLTIQAEGARADLETITFSDAVSHTRYTGLAARGTESSPAIIQVNDIVVSYNGKAWDGDSYGELGKLNFEVDGVPGDGDMPGRMTFQTTEDGTEIAVTRMTIKNNGNVGIFTVIPQARLQIGSILSSSTNTPESISLGGTFSSVGGDHPKVIVFDTGSFEIGLGVSLGQFDYISGATSIDHVWYSTQAASPLMFLDTSTGNLGIGNIVPNATLDVSGTVSATGLTITGIITGTTRVSSNQYCDENGINCKDMSSLDADTLDTIDSLSFLRSDADDTATGDITFSGIISATNDVNIGSGDLFVNSTTGKVGIGTTAPITKSHVSLSNVVETFTPTGRVVQTLEAAGNSTLSVLGGNGSLSGIDFSDTDSQASGSLHYYHSDDSMRFATGNSAEKMRIDSSGNVGIGTTAPGTLLNISSGDQSSILRIQRVDGGVPQGEILGAIDFFGNDSSGGDPAYIRARIQAVATDSAGRHTALEFFTSSNGVSTNRMILNRQGFLGVAVASPVHKIDVSGSAGLTTGTLWTNTSDERLKDIHGPFEYGLKEVLQLEPIWFNYKKDNPLNIPSDFTRTGFSAQAVQKIYPEAINTRDDGYLELNADPLYMSLFNAVKELNIKIERLERRCERKL